MRSYFRFAAVRSVRQQLHFALRAELAVVLSALSLVASRPVVGNTGRDVATPITRRSRTHLMESIHAD
jgi:hypothetical protein